MIKTRELIQLLESRGWILRRHTKHRHYFHLVTGKRITVPGRSGNDVPKGIAIKILKEIDA